MCRSYSLHIYNTGFAGLAQLLRGLRLPTFANWRWSTLKLATSALLEHWASLSERFPAHLFHNCRDKSRFRKVMACVSGLMFDAHLRFVVWLCVAICHIQDWIGGCDCHEDEFLAGVDVVCEHKGKRMNRAFTYGMECLHEMLRGIESWTPSEFHGDITMTFEVHACIRYAFALGVEKLAYLDTVPWLFSRLDQPGIKDKCIAQWESAPRAHHHCNTISIMDPTGVIRSDLDLIDHTGGGVSQAVERAIRAIKGLPMDDSIGEGPHAHAHRAFLHGRRSQWPFLAGSCRIVQNFHDIDNLVPATGIDVETEWRRYKTVLLVGRHGPQRNQRMPLGEFWQAVYRMGHVLTDDANDVVEPGDDQGLIHSVRYVLFQTRCSKFRSF
jgi:hypothetical protein